MFVAHVVKRKNWNELLKIIYKWTYFKSEGTDC